MGGTNSKSPRLGSRHSNFYRVKPIMLQLFKKERMWHRRELKPRYDVVIVGAGVHGLATAYYLGSRHGIRNIALLDKGYLGNGSSGRNTAIIRSNYRTPEGILFYDASLSSMKIFRKSSNGTCCSASVVTSPWGTRNRR